MRIGIKDKIVISFFAGAVVSLVLVGYSLFVISGLVSAMNRMQELTSRMDVTDSLNFQIQKLLKTSGDYLISGDVGKRDSFDALMGDISKNLNMLEGGERDERWESISNRVKNSTIKLFEMTLDIMYTDNPVGNRDAVALMNDASRYGETLIKDIEEVNRIVSADRNNLGVEAAGRAKRAKFVIYVLPVAGAVLLVFLYYYLKTHITDPIIELYRGAERVAGGDYLSLVEVETGDELEDLAEGFNMMAEALREREAKMFALIKVIDKVNNELIESDKHKAAFLSNVSHELKTPLTHILGFSELLKMEHSNSLPESGKKYLDNVNRSGHELLKLIEELLIVARGAGVMTAGEMKEVNAVSIAEDTIRGITRAVQHKEQTLLVSIDRSLSSVQADESMLRQIFNNLLNNAVKFTPSHGTIEFTMETIRENEDTSFKVTVKDTGPGIMPWMKDVLFAPFEIGEKTAMREYEGMGIGLTITKRFVEFHGGKIWFESEPGQGSVFMFTIPVRAKSAENVGE